MPPYRYAIAARRLRTPQRRVLLPQPLLRAVAIACVFYLALASCRALLPGLCANLPAAARTIEAAYGSSGEVRAKRPCCTASSAPYCAEDEPGATGPLAPRLEACAFCKITAVAGEPLHPGVLPLPAFTGFAPVLLRSDAHPPQPVNTASLGRAPPCLPFCCVEKRPFRKQ